MQYFVILHTFIGNFYLHKACNVKFCLISDSILKYVTIIVDNNVIADMFCAELSTQGSRLNIYITFIIQSQFPVPKKPLDKHLHTFSS